jgi:hypothetical protein
MGHCAVIRLRPVTSGGLVRATFLAAALLACASVLTGCKPGGSGLTKLCDVTYQGLSVRKGLVVNTVNASATGHPSAMR